MGRRSNKPTEKIIREYDVESLDFDAQGIAHNDEGKVIFIDGALPGERVQAQTRGIRTTFEKARVVQVLKESALRVKPKCAHYGVCGGCSMQHLDHSAQVAIKQRTLEDTLWHIGKVKPEQMLRPIEGEPWGYRYRARLSVRLVDKKGGMLIGFHEKSSSYVADMTGCEVLPKHVSDLLVSLRRLLETLSVPDRYAQIEVACGEVNDATASKRLVTALVLRHLVPVTDDDAAKLRAFALQHAAAGIEWWLQAKGPDTVHTLDNVSSRLAYQLPEFGVNMPYKPTDFTQVNHTLNTTLVSRALRLLQVQRDESVIDWFCGLGNFTLPLATQAKQVLGIEGSDTLVARARENAALNGLSERTAFEARNLFEVTAQDVKACGVREKWLIDPPREGALALAKVVAEMHEANDAEMLKILPKRIVYVSCNPATLARDAALLVHQGGYTLKSAGIANMFPHTSHVESIAVFER
jgi:23S rRNA (uracil1939-C5)-methyltransferase